MLTTAQFGYNPTLRTMFAVVGTLPEGTVVGDRYLQVESQHTGRVVTFELAEVDRRPLGSILHWRYVPVTAEFPCNVENLYVFKE